jgi:hypothetical protein
MGDNRMSGLKGLNIRGLKNIIVNVFKNLRINGLKDTIFKPRGRKNTDVESLTKSREEVKRQIKELVIEKKEIESRIGQLQKAGKEKNNAISEFSVREEIKVEKTDKPDELKETGKEELRDKVEIKAKEINVKSDSEKTDAGGSEEVNRNNSATKKIEEIVYPKNDEKAKEDSILLGNGSEKEKLPEKNKSESGKPVSDIFGGSLIEELLESDDLCPEEDQFFSKYIEEASVVDLVADLKEVKGLLAGTQS